jgi:hypothetical protein
MGYKIEHDGKSVELPEFGNIPAGVLRKARHEKETDQSWFILEQTLNAKEIAVLDSLPVSEFAKHMRAWTKGVSLGE